MSIIRSFAGLATTVLVALPTYPAAASTFSTIHIFPDQRLGGGLKAIRYQNNGYLIGSTMDGGTFHGAYYNYGNLFKLKLATRSVNVLYNFGFKPDGSSPLYPPAALGSNLVGVTNNGGSNSTGVVYRLEVATRTETILHNFGPTSGKADGANPSTPLLVKDDIFYGGTTSGGTTGHGTIFSLDSTTGVEKVVYNFQGKADGEVPTGRLIYQAGSLFGVASYDGLTTTGHHARGTVFKLEISTGALTVLHTFDGRNGTGFIPEDMSLQGHTLYGVTAGGGLSDAGTIFSIDLDTNIEKTVYKFDPNQTGSNPANAPLLMDNVLYGTTTSGGASGGGTLYSVDLSSSVGTVIHDFTGGADGSIPSGLIMNNGIFYGTTAEGGNKACHAGGCGTVFSFVP